MKKIVSFVIALVMVLGVIQVNAAIDYGKIKSLNEIDVKKNAGAITVSNKGYLDGVSGVYNICGGGASSRVTGKFNINFANMPSGAAAGDNIYIKFYYRINSKYTDGTTATVKPTSFYNYAKFGATSGIGGFGYKSAEIEMDKWYMGTVKTTFESASSAFLRIVLIFQAGEYVNVDIGEINAVYIGPVTYESTDELNVEGQINQLVSTASFSSISFDGEEINLQENPDSCNKTIDWKGTLPAITAKDGMGNTVTVNPDTDVVYDGKLPKKINLTAYALEHNKFEPDDTNKKVYTINLDYIRAASDVTVDGSNVTLNVDVYNLNNEKLNYVATLCIYEKATGKCVAAVPYNIALDETDDNKSFSFTYSGKVDYTDYECKSYVISTLRMFKVN